MYKLSRKLGRNLRIRPQRVLDSLRQTSSQVAGPHASRGINHVVTGWGTMRAQELLQKSSLESEWRRSKQYKQADG